MTLKCGQIVMMIGWVASLILASLPLFGINSYQKTAICLPMDVENLSGNYSRCFRFVVYDDSKIE